jgi:hypothetical protein
MPVFEGGILIPEISLMTKAAIKANPKSNGVGTLRAGENNELGIFFGGQFQSLITSTQDIAKAQPSGTFSNKGYIDPDAVLTGGPFGDSSVSSAPVVPESLDSLNYRNAKAKPTVDESGLGSVDDGFGV